MSLTQDDFHVDSIIDTINDRATEVRKLMITIGSILALLMPAVEMIGIIDFTPYGAGDDEWVTDDEWEWASDFTCGDGSRIEAALVDDGYKNCRDGSDEPIVEPTNNTTVVILPDNGTTNQTNNETFDEACAPQMWNAYWEYDNATDNITFYWDADLTCQDIGHNLTVIWTIYENETGNWTGLQDSLTYYTYYQDWDYVNLTLGSLAPGRYDIHSTFELADEYTRGTDWYDTEVY